MSADLERAKLAAEQAAAEWDRHLLDCAVCHRARRRRAWAETCRAGGKLHAEMAAAAASADRWKDRAGLPDPGQDQLELL